MDAAVTAEFGSQGSAAAGGVLVTCRCGSACDEPFDGDDPPVDTPVPITSGVDVAAAEAEGSPITFHLSRLEAALYRRA